MTNGTIGSLTAAPARSLPVSAPVQFVMWRRMTEIVESHNEPGTFSAIIGWEWRSNCGRGNSLHRNVIYRDGKDLANRVRPLATFDTESPALPRRGAQGPALGQPRPHPDPQGLGRRRGRDAGAFHDVAWSGDREPGEDGKVPAVGDTVDAENATWTNTNGAPERITV